MLEVGAPAPDFSVPDHNANNVSLKGMLEEKAAVLYFYPKDFTSGCTMETKYFVERYKDFAGLGAEVIGVSADSADSHGRFAKECGAEFPLLSDKDGRLREAYSVGKTLGIMPNRVTYVIDRGGKVRLAFSSQTDMRKHADEALRVLKEIHEE